MFENCLTMLFYRRRLTRHYDSQIDITTNCITYTRDKLNEISKRQERQGNDFYIRAGKVVLVLS